MAHETQGLRLSGSLYIARKNPDGSEQPLMGPLAANGLTIKPNVEKNDVTDKRRDRRGQILYSVSDPQSTTGTLTLMSVSQRAIAMNLMGSVSEVTTGAGTASGEMIYLEPDYSAELAHKAVSAVTLNAGVKASLATGTEVGNNAITWTAVQPGTDGNSITVALIDPSADDAALSVSVTDTDILVNLATGPSGTITSTAAQVIAAIEASAAASTLVTVANTGASTGASAVVAAAEANLTSGATSGGASYTLDEDFSVNPRLGIIRALESGDMTAGYYFASYSYAATSATRVSPSTTATVRARLLLDGVNDITERDVEFEAYSVLITPEGELDILNDEPINLEFSLTYETPSGYDSPIRLDEMAV